MIVNIDLHDLPSDALMRTSFRESATRPGQVIYVASAGSRPELDALRQLALQSSLVRAETLAELPDVDEPVNKLAKKATDFWDKSFEEAYE